MGSVMAEWVTIAWQLEGPEIIIILFNYGVTVLWHECNQSVKHEVTTLINRQISGNDVIVTILRSFGLSDLLLFWNIIYISNPVFKIPVFKVNQDQKLSYCFTVSLRLCLNDWLVLFCLFEICVVYVVLSILGMAWGLSGYRS